MPGRPGPSGLAGGDAAPWAILALPGATPAAPERLLDKFTDLGALLLVSTSALCHRHPVPASESSQSDGRGMIADALPSQGARPSLQDEATLDIQG